ncbi:MAG: V-type ATP synthase subunit A, partial [Candidatus Omnitrophica bacterium]|nr:V-type ATP synthase subunit A [Candidatus Omnitrophota bacterium]
PLAVELGPGLIGTIYDGIQRPLETMRNSSGHFIRKGVHARPLDRSRKWHFKPRLKAGEEVSPGVVLGTVAETSLVEHRVLVPPNMQGRIISIVGESERTVEEPVALISVAGQERPLFMYQRWPVRQSRPYRSKERLTEPLITGQRVIDTLFPVAKGGAVAVPGGFGTGKTIVQHQLAKWSDADIILFIGCGERGNEMTDVLLSFPHLVDPRSNRPLMERTILIANTSNMPVAAREASIYTGITLAEYYRDMGYHVAVMADSTSRWAEALRELSGRMEELPADEGFPAYLPTRLAEFYERAGAVRTLSDQTGSVTIVGSISPPGGDFSEPVTQHTKRYVRCFWSLDRDLANARHYPSISWLDSYSEYIDQISAWWSRHQDPQWTAMRTSIMDLLQQEARLQQVVKLVGPDVLPDSQKLILETCLIFRNAFLQQSAFDEVDMFTPPAKQAGMLRIILAFHEKAAEAIKAGLSVETIRKSPLRSSILRMKLAIRNDDADKLAELLKAVESFALQEAAHA